MNQLITRSEGCSAGFMMDSDHNWKDLHCKDFMSLILTHKKINPGDILELWKVVDIVRVLKLKVIQVLVSLMCP